MRAVDQIVGQYHSVEPMVKPPYGVARRLPCLRQSLLINIRNSSLSAALSSVALDVT